jgi:beta-galactosidase
MAVWQVPYETGILKAVGYSGKKRISEAELRSSGEVSQIKLSADRIKITANGQDLSYITVGLTDREGIINPKAENVVSYEISGPGSLAGIGNANPTSLESFQLPKRTAWRGKCMIVIKSDKTPGKITIKATSPGLQTAILEIESN